MVMDGESIYDTASRAPASNETPTNSGAQSSIQTSTPSQRLQKLIASPPLTTSTAVELKDDNGQGSFGFEMVEHDDGSMHISKVMPGEAAAGKLRIGDWVAAINGEPIDGDTLEEAVSKVQASPKRLVLQTEAGTPGSTSSFRRHPQQLTRISEASIPRYSADFNEPSSTKIRISNFTIQTDGINQTMEMVLSRNSPMSEFGFTVAELEDGTKYVELFYFASVASYLSKSHIHHNVIHTFCPPRPCSNLCASTNADLLRHADICIEC